jgi:hypothetical protein
MVEFEYKEIILQNEQRKNLSEFKRGIFDLIEDWIILKAGLEPCVLENFHFKHNVKIKAYKNSIIKIENCSFDGCLIIYPEGEDDISGINIYIYNTIVNNRINFNRVANYQDVSIYYSVIRSANFTDSKVDLLKIFRSEIDEVYFEGVNVNELEIKRSYIKKILNYDLISSSIKIDIESVLNHYKKLSNIKKDDFINHENINDACSKIKEFKKCIKSKKSPNPKTTFSELKVDMLQNVIIAKKIISKEKLIARSHFLKYIQLILSSKDESVDGNVISELNYIYFKNTKYPWYIHFLLSSVGFFYKPSKAILSSFLAIVFFGIVFYIIHHFNCRLLSLEELFYKGNFFNVFSEVIDAIYFSGITFFTIGYGETLGVASNSIEPIRKIFILSEAGTGILLTSSVLISFINKYLIKK